MSGGWVLGVFRLPSALYRFVRGFGRPANESLSLSFSKQNCNGAWNLATGIQVRFHLYFLKAGLAREGVSARSADLRLKTGRGASKETIQ